MKNYLLLLFLIIFSACSLAPAPQASPTTHILKANDKIVLQNKNSGKKSIKIAPIQTVFYLKSNEIAYIKDSELSAYSKHSWKNSPASSLTSLLTTKFEKNKLFKVVLNAGSEIQADLVLESRLDAFEQVFQKDKSYIHLELSASLISHKNAKLLGSRHFSYKISVQRLTPDSAISSFDEALNLLGDDMVLWINKLLK